MNYRWFTMATACAAWLATAPAQADTQGPATALAPTGQLCLEHVCLGMTLAEAEALSLAPAPTYGFKFQGKGDYYGLDSHGARVVYAETGDFDGELIRKFRASVATICRFGSANAHLTGRAGQRITLLFQPAIRAGKGELVVTEIASYLPKKLVAEEISRIKAEAKAHYGDAFSEQWTRHNTRAEVALYQNRMVGNVLMLRLPEQDLDAALRAQPGCAEQ